MTQPEGERERQPQPQPQPQGRQSPQQPGGQPQSLPQTPGAAGASPFAHTGQPRSDQPYPGIPAGQRPVQRGGGCGGCLRGCLVLVGVVLVAALVGLVVFQTVGKGWIYSQLPLWRQQNEWLDYAVVLFEIEKYLAPAQPSAKDLNARQPGQNDKAALPPDVPVYPDPLAETYNINPQQVTAFQRLAAAPDEVIDFFKQAMPRYGWQAVSEKQVESTTLLTWRKADRSCQTEILTREAAAELWLRCSVIKKVPATPVVPQ